MNSCFFLGGGERDNGTILAPCVLSDIVLGKFCMNEFTPLGDTTQKIMSNVGGNSSFHATHIC